MKRQLIKLISWLFPILFFPWGCAPVEIRADYLQKGFDYTQLGFDSLPESRPLNEKIVLNDIKVHIVGSLEEFEKNKFCVDKVGISVDPGRKHEIWVVGKKLKGKIIINQIVLGNQLSHLIHFNRPDVACPSRMEDFEACILLESPMYCK